MLYILLLYIICVYVFVCTYMYVSVIYFTANVFVLLFCCMYITICGFSMQHLDLRNSNEMQIQKGKS